MKTVFFFMVKNEIMQDFDLIHFNGKSHFLSESQADESISDYLQKQKYVQSYPGHIWFYQIDGIKFCVKRFEGSL